MTKKFLVSRKPPSSKMETSFYIEEAIISTVPLVKIIRITQSYRIGKKSTLEIKLNINNNSELVITNSTFEDLKRHCKYHIEYIRNIYNMDNKTKIILDTYNNISSKIMIASIDMENKSNKPYWCDIDITDNDKYTNEYLAINY